MTIEEEDFLNYLETIAIGRGGVSVQAMKDFKNYFFNLKKENNQLKDILLTEQQENIDLRKRLEDLKTQLYKSEKNVFAELNQETADSNAYLIDEVATLQEQIEKMKCCENCRHHNDGDCNSEHTYDCKHWNKQNREDFWEK